MRQYIQSPEYPFERMNPVCPCETSSLECPSTLRSPVSVAKGIKLSVIFFFFFLSAGETTYSLEHASDLRVEVQKVYELIDALR